MSIITSIAILLIVQCFSTYSITGHNGLVRYDGNTELKAKCNTENHLTHEIKCNIPVHNASETVTRKRATFPADTFHEALFVINKKGIYFYNKPQGEKLGHYNYGAQLKVISKPFCPNPVPHSKVDSVTWYGVEYNGHNYSLDTVYVQNEFLSKNLFHSDIEVFYIHSAYDSNYNFYAPFINLSEVFPFNYETSEPVVMQCSNFNYEVVDLTSQQKTKLLSVTGISPDDTVYIFSFLTDTVMKVSVNNTSAIANMNTYQRGSDRYPGYSPENDYELGLALNNNLKLGAEMIAYIGNTSPFKTGEVKAMKWTDMGTTKMPVAFDKSTAPKSIQSWFNNVGPGKVYKYTTHRYHHYVQSLSTNEGLSFRYLVVLDAETGDIVYKTVFIDSEGTFLIDLNTDEHADDRSYQWTGAIFKNKPPILYNFLGATFGCPTIEFISDTMSSVPILCDNRH